MNITALETANTYARLAKRIAVDANGCHNWTGFKTEHGYGKASFRNRSWYTHRLVMTLIIGQIPSGLEVHHKCFNTSCMNPQHLAVVTHRENVQMINPNLVPKSSSGQRGIYPFGGRGHFRVLLRRDGVLHGGGIHPTMEEAVVARDALQLSFVGEAA